MGINNKPPLKSAPPLTDQLKAKSRRRRESLGRLTAASTPARAPRNDLLPPLDLAHIPLDGLRMPARDIRKLDPAHVREVANSISALGFCAPILVGKNNLVLDGAVRVQAARLLGLGRAPCIRLEHLSENEQRVMRLAANRSKRASGTSTNSRSSSKS
jgi:ParB/Sulfiredoxin domain